MNFYREIDFYCNVDDEFKPKMKLLFDSMKLVIPKHYDFLKNYAKYLEIKQVKYSKNLAYYNEHVIYLPKSLLENSLPFIIIIFMHEFFHLVQDMEDKLPPIFKHSSENILHVQRFGELLPYLIEIKLSPKFNCIAHEEECKNASLHSSSSTFGNTELEYLKIAGDDVGNFDFYNGDALYYFKLFRSMSTEELEKDKFYKKLEAIRDNPKDLILKIKDFTDPKYLALIANSKEELELLRLKEDSNITFMDTDLPKLSSNLKTKVKSKYMKITKKK